MIKLTQITDLRFRGNLDGLFNGPTVGAIHDVGDGNIHDTLLDQHPGRGPPGEGLHLEFPVRTLLKL